jgi:hypothetical protein
MEFRFTYHATVRLAPGGDERAIGGAVTVALCGHWDHPGPCRWPHRTSLAPAGERVAVTVAYTCSDAEKTLVESMIDGAIRSGMLEGPEGAVTHWTVAQENRNPWSGAR